MKIAMGNDHAGRAMKIELAAYLREKGHQVTDLGTNEDDPADDYPTYGERVARAVADGGYDCGLLVCGTGVGMSLAANKVGGIRAVVCTEPYTAKRARAHNDANVLCLGARLIGGEMAKEIVSTFTGTAFEGGRHSGRIDMLADIERRERERA